MNTLEGEGLSRNKTEKGDGTDFGSRKMIYDAKLVGDTNDIN